MRGLESSAPLHETNPPKLGGLVAVGAKCPAKGTKRSSLGHRAGEGQEGLWPQGCLVFLERRGSAGPGQVSLLTAGRALATARGSQLAQEGQLQPSPAAREGESRLGWEISAGPDVSVPGSCASKGFAPGVTLGESLQLLGQFSFNSTCSTSVAGAALGFEGLSGAGSQSWLVLPG